MSYLYRGEFKALANSLLTKEQNPAGEKVLCLCMVGRGTRPLLEQKSGYIKRVPAYLSRSDRNTYEHAPWLSNRGSMDARMMDPESSEGAGNGYSMPGNLKS